MNKITGNTEFHESHARVIALVDRFQKYAREKYLLPSYQEAEARKDFIDPLFKALGWDVDHEREHNPYEQEVKVESSLNVHNARAQKKADYAFHLAPNFRDVRFYVEAKKPSVDLSKSIDAHFQILRYGYSASTPLAVLTDFEQIRVLDCRRRPTPDASALDRVYRSWHYTDFRSPEKFAEFYWLFSRQAHLDGSYQRRIEELPKPKGGAKQRGLFKGGYLPVDDSFLEDLSEYREALAKAFKRADHSLDSAALTEIVQRTLDRLVFLRFLEDKQIETEIRVSDFGKGKGAWPDFCTASKRLDGIYNGIVFKPLAVLDDSKFNVDDDIFADICERLAAENSPFNFDAIPIHILGSIYERFLGSVIRATEKRVFVEEKPEVRKAGGVYYTPEYVVRYIVKQTVGKQIKSKTPAEISKMHFADIACGSGSFLLGVFDELLRYHADWYNRLENDAQAKKDKCVRTEDGHWQLSLSQRRSILLNNIFGVDLDQQAVEVAQLSLFLKLLEDERATSARQYQLDYGRDASLKKLLPDLSSNIKCGNSLIGWDIASRVDLSNEDEQRLNPMNFEDEFPQVMKAGGFDAIVGNPPYEVVEKERSQASWPHQAFIKTLNSTSFYEAALGGKLNMYRFFVVRSIGLLGKNGRTGLIVPLSLLADVSCAKTRGFMIEKLRPVDIDCFPQKDNPTKRIFRDAKLSTVIYTGMLAVKKDPDVDVRIRVYPWNSFDNEPRSAELRMDDVKLLDPKTCPIPLVSSEQWLLCKKIHTRPGVIRFADAPGVQVTRGEINQTTYRDFITENPRNARLLKGVEVAQYKIRRELSQGHQEWFDESSYLQSYKEKPITSQKRIATQRITGVDEKLRIVATLVQPPTYFADSTNSIFVDKKSEISICYVLALLNSRLMQWRFKLTSTNNNVGTNEIESLPFFLPSSKEDREQHDIIVRKVDALLLAKQQEASSTGNTRTIVERKCRALENEINKLIYQLYGLTDDEIELIEL
ncbi:DNA methyltransferase [uncultured Xanthomonas sp.]|uniref:Eco57I restriction-modification methylase domain-containing protein n=1 Tax=uncultured Xanthomonas sp. TaxID=152831 RepID=UPI002600EA40|nr:DNA methyltransferase [uncultured Xanthomonas sp.]